MADNLTGAEYESWVAAKLSRNQALLSALVAPAGEVFHAYLAVDITKVSRPRRPRQHRSLLQPSLKGTRSMQMEADVRAAERVQKICDFKGWLTEALDDVSDPVNVSLSTRAAFFVDEAIKLSMVGELKASDWDSVNAQLQEADLPALERGHIASLKKFWQPLVEKPGQAAYGTVDVIDSKLMKCYAK